MSPSTSPLRRQLLNLTVILALLLAGFQIGIQPALADNTAQSLPFSQGWTNTSLITTDDNWSGVPGIIGYRGDGLTSTTGVDPQTVVADGTSTPVDVNANRTDPNTFTTGGVAEFQIANPVVALQGSGTARGPFLLLHLNTTGLSSITVSYNIRDIDGSADNAIQPVALQYRVGSSGNFTNLPAGFVADATTGPGLATLVTPVSVVLPAAANNQLLVQIRIITTDAVGSDEWVGIDDISATGSTVDLPPSVSSTSPINGAANVAVDANITINFSEAVTVTGNWFSIACTSSHAATVTGGPQSFTLDPDSDFANGETCTVTVFATQVTDQDGTADNMMADHSWSFSTVPPAGSVVVSQVYGGGGNTGANFKNDFIELYNRTASTISLSGWSVQYAAAAGSTWQVTALSGSIAPGKYYLVQEAQGAGGTLNLPVPDAVGTIPMAATAGKVALVNNSTALSGACPSGSNISDFVGYGTAANCFEGSGPTPAPSNTISVLRLSDGAQDTDNNNVDFVAGSPNPRNSHDPAPAVSGTSPTNGALGVALNANITINFSEPVDVTGNWFTISCATSLVHTAAFSGGPTSFTLNPDFDFASNESCMVTIDASRVTDQDTDDPPDNMAANYVFSFTTIELLVCGDPSTPIHDIQGSGTTSPMNGTPNVVIEGVVIGDYQNATQFSGFYIQEEDTDADADPTTSEGIFVFDNGFGVDVLPGDVVRVRGTVSEFSNLTELNSLSVVQVCSSGNSVTAANVTLPVASLNDWERYEGMLVNITQDLTATETFTLGRFGEVSLSVNGRLRNPTNIVAPGAPAIAQQDLNNRSRILLDDGNGQQNIDPTIHPPGGLSASNTLRSGYTVHGLTGVLEQRFGVYRVQPVGVINFDASTNPRTAAPGPVGGNLRVAALNVLNFFSTLDTGTPICGPTGGLDCRGANSAFEFTRQRDKIINAILAIDPDIAGLMEVQNDAGATIQNLVDGLNDVAGAGTYAYISTGTIGTDAIKVAIIYKPATVTPVGSYAILDSSVNPLFIDTKNRPTLAQTFMRNANGAKLTVVVNHLKSKGSDCNDVGDPDTGDGQGNCNLTRTKAATALVSWLATDPTGSGDPDFLIVGDMNSYAKEDPITTIKNAGYNNLLESLIGADAYSYVFDGQSGYLDHALASPSLAAQTAGVTEWHNNADEPTVLDYNIEFKTANQVNTFYTSDPYRASDHDPVVVGLKLNDPPTVDAGGPYPVSEGGSVLVTATGDDPNTGEMLTYDWDLDNNGSFETPGQSVSFDASALDGPSSHTIKVRVTDTGGLFAVAQTTVEVQNVLPTATLSNNGPVLSGNPVTVSFSNQFDPSTADTGVGFHYAFACDGSSPSAATYASSGSGVSTVCIFNDGPSLHTVRARIIDKDDGYSEYTTPVTVNSARPFYLHGTGPANNPPTLFLDNTTPTATTEKYKDSASVNFSGGNPWKDVGTWSATPALSPASLISLSNFHAWLGLKNSDDQGTNFDLRIEVYKNGALVASGESYCITGVTRNAALAKEVTLSFGSFSSATFNGTTDVLSLKVRTRIGTNGAGSFCGGHSNAVGLRLYFDAVSRPSRFDATFGP
jgi:predicted extracellular nuclease